MTQRGLKIIINGRATYVPYSAATKRFWAERNAIIKKPINGQPARDVEKNLATVMDATPEEVEKYLVAAVLPAKPKQVKVQTSNTDELAVLKAAFAQQQAELDRLKKLAEEDEEPGVDENGEPKPAKRGRKPKNQE